MSLLRLNLFLPPPRSGWFPLEEIAVQHLPTSFLFPATINIIQSWPSRPCKSRNFLSLLSFLCFLSPRNLPLTCRMACFYLEERTTHQSLSSEGKRAKVHGGSHLRSCMFKGEVPGLSSSKMKNRIRSIQVFKSPEPEKVKG